MDKDSILRAAYHANQSQMHREKWRELRHSSPQVEESEQATSKAERFDILFEELQPYLVNRQNVRWSTPKVPIHGQVEDHPITVWLYFETSGEGNDQFISYTANGRDENSNNMVAGHKFVRRSAAVEFEHLPEEEWSALPDLEETVRVYLEAVEQLSSEERQALGLPVLVS